MSSGEPLPEELLSAIRTIEARCPFGPTFFLSQLRSFVRERCRTIIRVTIRAGAPDELPVGFSQERSPAFVSRSPLGARTAEDLMQAAATGREV